MDSADDVKFRIIFSGDGAGRLRDKVREKLKELMEDYTDDTLVEYVIVLLKNGKRKEEAKNELNVFLGDDSDSFVSWLWDHLKSNLSLYAQPKDEVAKQKKEDGEGIKSKKRVSKDWRGVMRDPNEPPPLRSAVIANIHDDDNTLQSGSHLKRSPSPQPVTQRKRGRSGERGQIDERDERSQVKREAVAKPGLGASRRLLQFAVRDAVATSRSTLTSEPSFKRLRSVVSTPNEEDLQIQEHRPKIRSVARVPKPMAVAIKAVADAAKDVVKVKPSGNVFDRLGRSADLSDSFTEYREVVDEEDTQIAEATDPTYYDANFGYDNEGYSGMDRRGKMGISQIGHVGNSDSMVLDGTADRPLRDENSSHKTVNSSLTVNSGKPSQYQKPRAVSELENQKVVQDTGNSVAVSNGNGAPAIHAQREIQKTELTGANPGSRPTPTEDVDSRTIFVSNVHFGATKDGLSRHFNKFGDVLKVVIVTEAATGQPKGSAYVEFMRKEAAENALSLDGTSFMSRILKVVRKSSANAEGTPAATQWARATRGSASRFGRVGFARGGEGVGVGVGVYRPRLPLKPGARSLQWKRGDAQTSSENIIPSPTPPTAIPTRSLTYVRPTTNNA